MSTDMPNLNSLQFGSSPANYRAAPDFPTDALSTILNSSDTNAAANEIRPQLRADACFFLSRNGVFFRSDSQRVFLPGEYYFDLMVRLEPLLTGEYTLEEIISACSDSVNDRLSGFVRFLMDAGILRNARQATQRTLEEKVVNYFRPHLRWLSRLAPRPLDALSRLRSASVLIVGNGESALKCASTLGRCGVAHISLLQTGVYACNELVEVRQEMEKLSAHGVNSEFKEIFTDTVPAVRLRMFDVIAYIADFPTLGDIIRLNRACSCEGCRFIPGFAVRNIEVFGPVVLPEAPGCWACGLLRIMSDISPKPYEIALRTSKFFRYGFSSECPSIPIADLVGKDLATEIMKLVIESPRVQSYSRTIFGVEESPDSFDTTVVRNVLTSCVGECTRFLAMLNP
jgi:hypothetical protein